MKTKTRQKRKVKITVLQLNELLIDVNIEELQLKSIIEYYFKITEDFVSIQLNKALEAEV